MVRPVTCRMYDSVVAAAIRTDEATTSPTPASPVALVPRNADVHRYRRNRSPYRSAPHGSFRSSREMAVARPFSNHLCNIFHGRRETVYRAAAGDAPGVCCLGDDALVSLARSGK